MRITGILVLVLLLSLSSMIFFTYKGRYTDKFSYDIVLPILVGENKEFDTSRIQEKKRPYIINVFASWCETCLSVHETWVKIAAMGSVDMYGIDYIDIPHKALEWLKTHGNPYIAVASDSFGKSAKAFGITGVPETFIFDKHGKLLLHISGGISMDMWNNRISRILTS